MNDKNIEEPYTSPKAEVFEIKIGQMICQSGDTPGLTNDDTPYGF